MAVVHAGYCDGCGQVITGDPVYARRRYSMTTNRSALSPARKFHRDCLARLFDYVEVDGPHGWPVSGNL